jgi:acyl phosphate:glycerol-3-phosphate acyltransferase
LAPYALLCVVGVWGLVLVLSRYVSLASICAAAALPLFTWLTQPSAKLTGFTGLMGALAIYKHRSNIQRLLHGTENRFGKKPAATSKPS